MSTAAMSLRLRPRPPFGPALGRFRVPFGPLVVSVGAHVVLIVALVAGAATWRAAQPKTYVVNLVPAVATVGTPQASPAPAPPAPAPAPPAPAPPARTVEPTLPARTAAKELPPVRELPSKDLPPSREPATLPERGMPPRTAALPRAGNKELPAVGSAVAPRPVPSPAPITPPVPITPPATPAATPAPPPTPGDVAGSPQGAGALTLNVSDFPYAWYIQAVHRKIQERWEGRAIHGRQPEVIFEIARDGQLRRVSVGKSSGNPAYDQLATRAVAEANPFPPLPDGFPKNVLIIGLQFIYDPRAR